MMIFIQRPCVDLYPRLSSSTCVAKGDSLSLDIEDIIISSLLKLTPKSCSMCVYTADTGGHNGSAFRTALNHYLFDNQPYSSYTKVQPYVPDLSCRK